MTVLTHSANHNCNIVHLDTVTHGDCYNAIVKPCSYTKVCEYAIISLVILKHIKDWVQAHVHIANLNENN